MRKNKTHEIFKALRLACSYTKEYVAATTGIPVKRYRNIENGKIQMTDDEFDKLVRLYNTNKETLENLNCNIYFSDPMFDDATPADAHDHKLGKLSADEYMLISMFRKIQNQDRIMDIFFETMLEEEPFNESDFNRE